MIWNRSRKWIFSGSIGKSTINGIMIAVPQVLSKFMLTQAIFVLSIGIGVDGNS